jgi:hypothetical protein
MKLINSYVQQSIAEKFQYIIFTVSKSSDGSSRLSRDTDNRLLTLSAG